MADAKKYTSKLSGAKVLIVGGTSGIGFCVAEALLENNASVVISSSNPSKIDASLTRLLTSYPSAKDRLAGFPCDLSDGTTMESNIKTLYTNTEKRLGKLDHLIFTAGDALATVSLQDATLESIQRAGHVRFFAPLLFAKHAPTYLNPGPASSIVLTTGAVSNRPMANWTVVGCYAGGLHAMTRGLALDLAPLRVNLVNPGAVSTELWDIIPVEQREGMQKSMKERTTTKKVAVPEEIAEAYLYVMKDTNVTGSSIDTNSGALLL